MAQAAARGVVDFSKANVLSRKWWQRLWLMLDQVEADNLLRVRTLQHAQNAAVVAYDNEPKTFELHWEECNKACTDMWNLMFPWMHHTEASQNERLRDAWAQRYGDPADPLVKERIRKTAEHMHEMREKQLERGRRMPRSVIRRKVTDAAG